MRSSLNADGLLDDVAGCLIGLESTSLKLKDIDLALRDELSGLCMIDEIGALEHGGHLFCFEIGVRQLLLGVFDVLQQFALLGRQLLIALLASSVLDIIKDFDFGIGMRFVFGADG